MSKNVHLAALREKFIQQHGDYVFDKADVVAFLEPYLSVTIDKKVLVEREKSRVVGRFIQSLRDERGRREAIVFDSSTEDTDARMLSYAFIGRTRDLEVLNRQEAYLMTNVDGLLVSINKIREAKYRLNVGKAIEIDATHRHLGEEKQNG